MARSSSPHGYAPPFHPLPAHVFPSQYVYLYIFVHSPRIILSFIYSLRESNATFVPLDRRFPPTFSPTFNVSPFSFQNCLNILNRYRYPRAKFQIFTLDTGYKIVKKLESRLEDQHPNLSKEKFSVNRTSRIYQ